MMQSLDHSKWVWKALREQKNVFFGHRRVFTSSAIQVIICVFGMG